MSSLKHYFVVIFLAMITYWKLKQYRTRTVQKSVRSLNETYDYVVIGGGSAGCTVASRLAEDSEVSVLILEAGKNFGDDPMIYEPPRWIDVLHSSYDWAYLTEPQDNAFLGMTNKRGYWPRGRVLGGSGSINVLQYTRGSPFDFDEWASNGYTGWSYKDVLPYFLKTEDIQIEALKGSKFHNVGGEIAVEGGDLSPLATHFRKAGEELGYKITDYNGEAQEGFSRIQFNIRKGVRSSAAIELLKEERDNLHVSTESHVVKIDIVDKKAVGVTFIKDGRKQYVRTRKEIILSAGTINSPQILMLSGIGPKEHLEKLGIPVKMDLPVGENLQDHVQFSLCSKISKPYTLTEESRNSIWSFIQYHLFGTGPLSITGSDGSAFFHLNPKDIGKTYPDIQMVLFPSIFDKNIFNFNEMVAKEILLQTPNTHGFCIFTALTHPRSRGSVRLKSSDPFDYPSIDPKYFTDNQDVLNLVGGARIWEKLMQTKPFKDIGANFEYMKTSFCSEHPFRSDDYWACLIRHTAFTQFHPTSTCKMGPANNKDAVVDLELRVKGVESLRVVDASIFPNVTSGNTNAPTIMVAEKAADMIRGKQTVNHLKRSL